MNWDAISALSEFIGAVAVVITLIYLAVQVRQNTQSIKTSTLQANTALWTSMFSAVAQPELTSAYLHGSSAKADINPVQYVQFFMIARSMFVAFENQYYQYRQGTLDESTYLGYERCIATQLLNNPGFRVWWEQNRAVFSPEFAEYVDQLITNTPLMDEEGLVGEWRRLAGEYHS